MSELYAESKPKKEYEDRHSQLSAAERQRLLDKSTTLYVGNLNFETTEEQLYEVFSLAGDVKRVIMGLDKVEKTPCGFCFVEYFARQSAQNCIRYLSYTKVDERSLSCDFDTGFEEGRQYGRGSHGGQRQDEFRITYDSGRGGYGKRTQELFEKVEAFTPGADKRKLSLLQQQQQSDSNKRTETIPT